MVLTWRIFKHKYNHVVFCLLNRERINLKELFVCGSDPNSRASSKSPSPLVVLSPFYCNLHFRRSLSDKDSIDYTTRIGTSFETHSDILCDRVRSPVPRPRNYGEKGKLITDSLRGLPSRDSWRPEYPHRFTQSCRHLSSDDCLCVHGRSRIWLFQTRPVSGWLKRS